MRNDKQKAIILRRRGYSYNEIHATLHIPKGTLSLWLRDIVLSKSAQERIGRRVHRATLLGIVKHNKRQTHHAVQRMRDGRKKASDEIDRITQRDLWFMGIALYWAEGYKRTQIRNGRAVTYHSVVLSNSDPSIIRLFLRFLREVCHVSDERMKAEVRMYEHMSERATLEYWKRITGLSEQQFTKTYYGVSKSSLGVRPFHRLPHGTIAIRVNDTILFHRIMGWIEGLARV